MSGLYSPLCRSAAALLAVLALSACDENGAFSLDSLTASPAATAPAGSTPAGEATERDVEAPEVFSAKEEGLWDGRPSLGGVWVAHPDADAPERVIIRNVDNGQFVVGALFRRERDVPGPRLQLSSDAATALNILAGAPTSLDVTALRRETVEAPAPEPVAEDAVVAAQADGAEDVPVAANAAAPALSAEEVAAAAETDKPAGSADPIALATAALGEADAAAETGTAASSEVAASAAAAPVTSSALPSSSLPASTLSRPWLQAATLSTEENAARAVSQLSNAGLNARSSELKREGKSLWRVVVGPATSEAERNEMLEKVKKAGFADAFPVTN
ncbi:SPOR domain-containing protein [uncultured Roseobacter sp.]|uniref:SPOR domain-containing protein n=1 Tax=uncultured Roseobacter sp. TaxID=114847 RepID=UPI0026047A02|nr:SPOR domain-containing protein [uncultured Roseobacter sp.]